MRWGTIMCVCRLKIEKFSGHNPCWWLVQCWTSWENAHRIQRKWKCRPIEHHGRHLLASSQHHVATSPSNSHLPVSWRSPPPFSAPRGLAKGVHSHWLNPIRIFISLGLSDWLRSEWLIPSELMKLERTLLKFLKKKQESFHCLEVCRRHSARWASNEKAVAP